LGIRAFWLSKFNLAERSFKRAVEINPNSEAAQIMLINLLRFRNREAEAYADTQKALKRHPESAALRKDLVICMQTNNPSAATQQAFLVNCLQNGIMPAINKPEQSTKSTNESKEQKSSDNQKANTKNSDLTHKQIDKTNTVNKQDLSNSKAVYEPVKTTANKPIKVARIKSGSPRTHKSTKLPSGLVPPPPPDAFGFLAQPRTGMKAKASSIKSEPTQAAKPEKATASDTQSEEPKKHIEHSTAESDPDFLIEWASVKKKRGASK